MTNGGGALGMTNGGGALGMTNEGNARNDKWGGVVK